MTFTYLFSQVKCFVTWNRKFSCCKASRNATNCVETETQKWTWDMWQKDLTSPSIRICPLFDELKKGDFFYPLPPIWTNVSFSANFFFWRHPLGSFLLFWSNNSLGYGEVVIGNFPNKVDFHTLYVEGGQHKRTLWRKRWKKILVIL